MHKIDGAGHVNHTFVNEDPATNRPGTEVTPEWLNALQEENTNVIELAQIALNKGDNTQLKQALLALFPLKEGSAGVLRTLTPAGGARVRELGDIPNAATVGGIEYGIAYNCNIDPVTGVWAGRDVADICWLEKWTDVGGVKEFWYAPNAADGAAPAWALAGKIDLVNGIPQFDTSKRLATMEALQRALGNMQGSVDINAATVLTSADVGKACLCYGGAGFTVTIPDSSTCPPGSVIEIESYLTAGNVVTINRSGANLFYGNSSGITSFTLNPGDSVRLMNSASGNRWILTGGSAQLEYSGGRIGVNQSWQNVSASRVMGTAYINTTGKTMAVSVLAIITSSGNTLQGIVNGVAVVNSCATPAGTNSGLMVLVPPGATYSIGNAGGGAGAHNWYELR
ncbi:hypothetical protein [Candidatus Ferrigenium straubiae]|jgi:hypothetical protein|uniref:hypothetical protein n=1 Tax=Candidatus Ferrigenium straubiae TaxID=2919506 RepID=UPI003F4AA9D1